MERLSTKLLAAYNAFTGKVPAQGKAVQDPFFYNYSMGGNGSGTNLPARNLKINANQLRNFSESPIPRRAIDYIRNNVARLEWKLIPMDGVKLTAQEKKQVEIATKVLMNPNPDDNWGTFIGQICEDMLVIGEGVSEIKTFSGHPDRPYLLYIVDPASVSVYMDWDGSPNKPRYAQVDMHQQKVDFNPTEMVVFKHNPRSNNPFGLSPTAVAVQQIQYLLESQSYAGKTASNAYPKKMLWMGQDISESQLRAFRQYMHDEIEGRSHLPVTGGHDKPESIELGHVGDEALFLQWQQFMIATIANAYNLDIMKFNAIVGINRSTGDQLDDSSDEGAIRPMAHSLEHYINQYILSLFGLSEKVRFKFQYTTSFSDRKSLAVIQQIQLQADMITLNEARRENGYPDLPYDKSLGYSKGDLTLSEYRSVFGQAYLQDAVGVDEDMGTEGMTEVQDKTSSANQENADTKQKQVQSQNSNGGNNGVNGAKQPKEKNVHSKTDGTEATL